MIKTKCLNGYLQVGDHVLSTVDDDYPCLQGIVFDIIPLGAPNRETDNETDDVYVDFTGDYSDRRIREIEQIFSELYDLPKSIEDITLDYVIMDPECLIKLDDVEDSVLNWIMESEANAVSHGFSILKNLYDDLKAAAAEQSGTRILKGKRFRRLRDGK